ncbi:hypothetical protein Trydic_g3255 [Trypoxylus dichotomus]
MDNMQVTERCYADDMVVLGNTAIIRKIEWNATWKMQRKNRKQKQVGQNQKRDVQVGSRNGVYRSGFEAGSTAGNEIKESVDRESMENIRGWGIKKWEYTR